MQVLFFKWSSFLNEGILQALEKLGITYTIFAYDFTDWEKDDRFLELFRKALIKAEADVVLSVNYSPLIAQVCSDLQTNYMAWIYD